MASKIQILKIVIKWFNICNNSSKTLWKTNQVKKRLKLQKSKINKNKNKNKKNQEKAKILRKDNDLKV